MKLTDIGGFIAILIAGYIVGRDTQKMDFPGTDLFGIMALLGLGFYLAVWLS
jgi:hypothetical protein